MNGSVGTVVDFIADASGDNVVDVVVVDIPKYRGPHLWGDEEHRRTTYMGPYTEKYKYLVHKRHMQVVYILYLFCDK